MQLDEWFTYWYRIVGTYTLISTMTCPFHDWNETFMRHLNFLADCVLL